MMKKILTILLVACLATNILWAQDAPVNKESKPQQTDVKTNEPDSGLVYKTSASMDLSKLTGDQIKELEERKLEKEQIDSAKNILQEVLIPVVAISFPFTALIFIVFFVQFFRNKEKKNRYKLMMKAIESGKEIPLDFFKEISEKKSPLISISVYIAVGVGIITFFSIDRSYQLIGLGLIPLLIGLGKLFAWGYEERKELRRIESKNKDANQQ